MQNRCQLDTGPDLVLLKNGILHDRGIVIEPVHFRTRIIYCLISMDLQTKTMNIVEGYKNKESPEDGFNIFGGQLFTPGKYHDAFFEEI